MDVDQALVRPDLEMLLRVLVLERRLDDRVDVAVRRQRHGTGDGRAGARRRLDDLLRRRLEGLVVVGLQADADLVLGGGCHVPFSAVVRLTSGGSFAGCLRGCGGGPCADGRQVSAPGAASYLALEQAKGGALSAPRPREALLDDLGHDARADRAATLADGEAQA